MPNAPAAHGRSQVPGRRLGVDVGSVRVGVAVSDQDAVLAVPLTTVRRDPKGRDIAQLARLVAEYEAVEVVVGLPLSLSGARGPAAVAASRYAARLAKRIAPVPVRFTDERLTTVVATRALRSSRLRGRAQRAIVDQVAAVEILQSWLDASQRTRCGVEWDDQAGSDSSSEAAP